jgi:hypothetical protein
MQQTLETVAIIRDLGGYGLAAVIYWFWRRSDAERIRYRDLHEKVLSDFPQLTNAIEALSEHIKTTRTRSNGS